MRLRIYGYELPQYLTPRNLEIEYLRCESNIAVEFAEISILGDCIKPVHQAKTKTTVNVILPKYGKSAVGMFLGGHTLPLLLPF